MVSNYKRDDHTFWVITDFTAAKTGESIDAFNSGACGILQTRVRVNVIRIKTAILYW